MKKVLLALGLLSFIAAGCNITPTSTNNTNSNPLSTPAPTGQTQTRQNASAQTSQNELSNGNVNSTIPIPPNIIYARPVSNGDAYKVTAPDTVYENVKANFSISIPVGYQYRETAFASGYGEDILEIWNPNYPNNFDSVVVSVYSEPDMTNGKTYAHPSQFLKDNSFVPDNGKVVSTTYTTQAGYEAVVQTITTPNGEGKIRAILKDKTIYVILDSPSTDKDFENIAESLKFIK